MAITTWTGAVNNDWFTGGNWTTGIPGPADTAVFNASATASLGVTNTQVATIRVATGANVVLTSTLGAYNNVATLTFEVNGTGQLTFNVPITAATSQISKTGTGRANLTRGDNALTADISVAAGTLGVTSSGVLNSSGTFAGGLSIQGNLIFDTSANQTLSGLITGFTGVLQKDSPSTLTIAGLNIFASSTVLNAGSLVLGNAAALGTSIVNVNGGNLDLGGFTVTYDVVQAGGQVSNGTLQNGSISTTAGTISATISGNPVVTKTGAGTSVFTGSNTYASGTTVSEGTLQAGTGSAFGSGSVTLGAVSPATLNFGGFSVLNSVLSQNGILRNGAAYAGTVTVPSGGQASIPSGEILAGTAVVAGNLFIAGRHAGTINNSATGFVQIGNATVANPPVNIYNGSCGSTYAVLAS